MIEDSVLREVREAREAYAKEHGFNVHAIVADLRRLDARGDRKVVRLSPRRPIVYVTQQPSENTTNVPDVSTLDSIPAGTIPLASGSSEVRRETLR